MAPTTKRCPGVESLGLPAHEATATLEFFASNAANADHLATRCKVCGAAYGKAWSAAKKAGTTFSSKGTPGQAMPARVYDITPEGKLEPRKAEPTPIRRNDSLAGGLTYADKLAERAALRKARGYTTEVVGGVIYALPGDSVVGTPEGQAALEALNRARDAERRRRNTEAKRAQRARAKAAAAESDPGTSSVRSLLRL